MSKAIIHRQWQPQTLTESRGIIGLVVIVLLCPLAKGQAKFTIRSTLQMLNSASYGGVPSAVMFTKILPLVTVSPADVLQLNL